MSQDQAAGLRQWADRQRAQREAQRDTPPQAAPVVRTPLMVVGVPGAAPAPVSDRLAQWASLGRAWAKAPEAWEIHCLAPTAPTLTELSARYARWAFWIESDADAFASMYRQLRLMRDHGGPKRLLALHEPHLPRHGLLGNLQAAAHDYLGLELLLLARR